MKKYPVTVVLQVHITDGEQVGSANYHHGWGNLPSEEDVSGILDKVSSQLPDGFRLMNRAESFMHYAREERGYRGQNMVIPRRDEEEWHDPRADTDFTHTNDYPDDEEEDY